MAERFELRLRAWRRPVSMVGWANVLQLPIVIAFGAFVVVGGLIAVHVVARWALILGALLGAGSVMLLIARDFRKHPAGVLRLESGRLLFTAWRGRVWDVDVKEVAMMRLNGIVLAVHFRRAAELYIHEQRIDVPLTEVLDRIGEHLGVSGEPRPATFRDRLSMTRQLLRTRWPYFAAAIAVFLLFEWLAHAR